MPESLSFPQINYFVFLTYHILLFSHLSRREEKLKDDINEGQNTSLQRSCSFAFSSLIIVLFLSGCAENSNILDNTQNRQLRFSVSTYGWNNSNSSSNSKSNSRATPITGNTFDTSKSFNIIADVSKVSNWSTEVKNETVSYSSTNNIWQTTAIHYWPGQQVPWIFMLTIPQAFRVKLLMLQVQHPFFPISYLIMQLIRLIFLRHQRQAWLETPITRHL